MERGQVVDAKTGETFDSIGGAVRVYKKDRYKGWDGRWRIGRGRKGSRNDARLGCCRQ